MTNVPSKFPANIRHSDTFTLPVLKNNSTPLFITHSASLEIYILVFVPLLATVCRCNVSFLFIWGINLTQYIYTYKHDTLLRESDKNITICILERSPIQNFSSHTLVTLPSTHLLFLHTSHLFHVVISNNVRYTDNTTSWIDDLYLIQTLLSTWGTQYSKLCKNTHPILNYSHEL